jgi:hypothetical protein
VTTAPSGPSAPQPPPPSLEVVKDELDRVQSSCEARSNGVDTKAGLILATAGALIGFHASDPSLLDVLAEVVALGAAAYAIYAFHPRPGDAVSPRVLYQAHLDQPGLNVLEEMIKGRLVVWERDEKALTAKAQRLTWATTLLAVSALLFIVSSTWKLGTSQPSPIPIPSPLPRMTSSSIAPTPTTTPATPRVVGPTSHAGPASIDLNRPPETT